MAALRHAFMALGLAVSCPFRGSLPGQRVAYRPPIAVEQTKLPGLRQQGGYSNPFKKGNNSLWAIRKSTRSKLQQILRELG